MNAVVFRFPFGSSPAGADLARCAQWDNTARRVTVLAGLLLPGALCSSALAALAVSPIFGSNMVLQRNASVPVFGTATAGTNIIVQFQNQSISTVATSAGKWQVNLSSMAASTAANALTVSAPGNTTINLTGVQVGEVWLCSGQSNMGKTLSYADDSAAAIADAANHNIRLFKMIAGNGPATSTWQVSNSTTAASFSAVGYWMGLELEEKYQVPVGLIMATHDGTDIANWEHTDGGTGVDYDAMVKPIQPVAITGIAWYQGENNGGDAAYETKLTNMISAWRADWGQNYPFGIVQLPSSKWEAARSAQYQVSQKVANTFLVVTSDLPNPSQLHPTTKKPIGIRLAVGARGKVYGESIVYSGPVPNKALSSISGNTISLNFNFAGSGLSTMNGAAVGYCQTATATGRWGTATGTIVGGQLNVTGSVANPTRVRVGYGGQGNLSNIVSVPVEGGASTMTKIPASLFEVSFP